MTKKIAAFTGGLNDPSSRFRIREYDCALRQMGYILDEYYSRIGKYPPKNFAKRVFWFILINLERLFQVLKYSSKEYDITFLQREMISTLFSYERFIKRPIVFDVDDSIHLGKRKENIVNIARHSDIIICGNNFLADFYKKVSKNVYVVPTPVDVNCYSKKNHIDNSNLRIGWIGTQSNFIFLYKIEMALNQILEKNTNVKLVIVSDKKPKFQIIRNYKFIKWSNENEVQSIQDFDIGLMPLDDSEWSKGKCSFKMLQYMACGIPVVVSPVGMNIEVLSKGEVGFGASNYYEDWIESLTKLINSFELRVSMGKNGRRIVEENYSIEICLKELIKIISKHFN